jgi:hypothetical protein
MSSFWKSGVRTCTSKVTEFGVISDFGVILVENRK